MSDLAPITSENILDALKLHPKEHTPAVCLLAGNEIKGLRAALAAKDQQIAELRLMLMELRVDLGAFSGESDNWHQKITAALAGR